MHTERLEDWQTGRLVNYKDGWSETVRQADLVPYSSVGQLAWDWAGGNWYLLDSDQEAVFLCRLKSGEERMTCKSVISTGVSKPRGIAVDPAAGFFFLTSWGRGPPRLLRFLLLLLPLLLKLVLRAAMDGTDQKDLVSANIVYPYGVTVDHPRRQVYWVDTYLDQIERCDYSGEARRTIVRGRPAQNLYGLAVFQTLLLSSSWRQNSILSTDKFRPVNSSVLVADLARPTALRVFHRQSQPVIGGAGGREDQHPCRQLDPCHHFCLPQVEAPHFSCRCKTGFRLTDQRTGRCSLVVKREMLLYSQSAPGAVRGVATRVETGQQEAEEVMVPVSGLARPTALDFHYAESYVYFSDSQRYRIQRARLLGERAVAEDFLASGLTKVEGLALDWVAANLYWSDEGQQAIYAAPLSLPSLRRTVVQGNLSHPRALALHPERGLLFWSDWASVEEESDVSGTIGLASMSGEGRRLLVTSDLHWPNGLTVDMENSLLYWCDTWAGRLERIGYDGQGRTTVYSSQPLSSRPYGLTLLHSTLYWTQYTAATVVSLDIATNSTSVLRQENPQLLEIKAFSSSRQPVTSSPCPALLCSHLCLLSPAGAECACSDGHQLANDARTCDEDASWRPPQACGADKFQCGGGELRCVSRSFVCDGVPDCSDGSDEVAAVTVCVLCALLTSSCRARIATQRPPARRISSPV